jgi:integrase
MGLYRRGNTWWLAYTVNGKKINESARTANKRDAQRILDKRLGQIVEDRFDLPVTRCSTTLDVFAKEFLQTVAVESTRLRYASSVGNIRKFFGSESVRAALTTPEIERFKQARLAAGVSCATVNRDLAVLRILSKRARRQRIIPSNGPCIEMLNERSGRRKPVILSFEEEEKLLLSASPQISLLVSLILDTGLRVKKEALRLRWVDIDLNSGHLIVNVSKTAAGERVIPLTERSIRELRNWRSKFGPEFSHWVFANPREPKKHLTDIRFAWRGALVRAGLPYRRLYDLRAVFASRLSAAGQSSTLIAGLLGHASTAIVPTYAKVTTDFHRWAITQLEQFCVKHSADAPTKLQ